jgi:hypothetical protein
VILNKKKIIRFKTGTQRKKISSVVRAMHTRSKVVTLKSLQEKEEIKTLKFEELENLVVEWAEKYNELKAVSQAPPQTIIHTSDVGLDFQTLVLVIVGVSASLYVVNYITGGAIIVYVSKLCRFVNGHTDVQDYAINSRGEYYYTLVPNVGANNEFVANSEVAVTLTLNADNIEYFLGTRLDQVDLVLAAQALDIVAANNGLVLNEEMIQQISTYVNMIG